MLKVVLVEDEMLLRKDIIMTIPWEAYGCEVVGEAYNGKDGEGIIRDLKPDIVITDIYMPETDGITMIKNLQDIPAIEYIIISGYGEFEYAREALKMGVKNYILKPIDDEELRSTIMKIVRETYDRQNYVKMKENYMSIINRNSLQFKDILDDTGVKSKGGYLKEAIEYIDRYYGKDISIKDVADNLHISESYLSKLFKSETSFTFVDYLTNKRIKKAIELIKTSNEKIYEVSSLIGFSDYRYFSTIFKKLVGVSPTEFKKWLYE